MSLCICQKSIKDTMPRVNPNVTYGLRVIMTCQCRFTDCSKCLTLVRGFGCEEAEAGDTWENPLRTAYCQPKTALET